MIKNLRSVLVTVLLLLSLSGFSQVCPGTQITLSIQNITNPTPTTLEYDVFVMNSGASTVKFTAFAGNVRFPGTLNGAGTLSLSVVDQPNAGNFPTLTNVTTLLQPTQARWTQTPITEPNGAILPPSVPLKFARFRLTNSIPWSCSYVAQLTLAVQQAGVAQNVMTTYCNGNTNSVPASLANNHFTQLTPAPITLNPAPTTGTTSNPVASGCFGDDAGEITITLSPLPSSTSISYVLDTFSPVTTSLNASGAFTLTGLPPGPHSVVITSGSCPPLTVNFTIAGPTVPLTNTTTISNCGPYTWSVNGTTYTTSGVYTGTSVNGSGCDVDETLNLTINATSSGTTTASICGGSYTWAGPLGDGNTYTTNQNITFVSTNANGCNHTQTLNLTVTNIDNANLQSPDVVTLCPGNSFTALGRVFEAGITDASQNLQGAGIDVEFGISAVGGSSDPTTWPAGNWSAAAYNPASSCYPCNDDEYQFTTGAALAAGVYYYTFRYKLSSCTTWQYGGYPSGFWNGTTQNSGMLTITTATTNGSVTTTACDTYTWPANGVTYTTSQTNLTFVSGCNTATLNLTITNSTSGTTTATACDTYTWAGPLGNGNTYTTNQNITFVTTNAAGCNHTQTLNLTINNSTTGTTTATACDTYTWAAPLGNGLTYTSSQNLTHTSVNAAGCPHVQTLNLTINNSTSGTTTASACGSYTWAGPLGNGNTYTTNQNIINVTTNAAGCPHTETLILTINSTSSSTITTSACNTYTWPLPLGTGLTYTTSQNNLQNVTTNASGCTHTETLNLTINVPTSGTTTTTACDSYTWAPPLGNGLTYTTNQNITFVSTNAAGCAHTQTLNLTINNSTSGTTTATACDSYTWAGPLGNGQTYTTSQNITHVTTNAAGCPHTQTLNLTITNSTTGTTNAAACTTYTWAGPLGNGQTYTTSQAGVINVTTNAAGCPHTQILNLVINNPTTGTTTASACNTYTWAGPLGNGQTYTTSQAGVVHVSTNANGCQHTQTLNLTINNSTTGTTNALACDSFTWAAPLGNGQTYTSSVSGVVHTSINSNGCSHTQTLNLTVSSNSSGTTNAFACNGYYWAPPLGDGQTYNTSVFGITHVSTNAAGCSNTQMLNLTVNYSTADTTNITTCGSYTWAGPLGNGLTYTSSVSGITHQTTNAAGCVHTQTLNLTINSSTSGTTTTTACNSYTWAGPLGNGQTYTTSQTGITHVSTNAFGCPHTQTLNLTINNGSTGTTTATACDTYTWALPLGNGQTYTSSAFGVTNTIALPNGCSHVQTLNLTINNSTSATTTATACDSYTWALPFGNGLTYTTSQNGITHITTNANGCPHTQTLNLTINSSTVNTTNVTACTSYTWAAPLGNGQTYTSSVSGVTNVTTNAAGCTHTETLNLTINQNTTFGSITAVANNSYTWAANGQTYTASGTYTYITTNSGGCTNTATLNLTINIVTGTPWYADTDGDGYGNPNDVITAPVAPPGYVAIGTDCNDLDPTINPGAIEVCYDGIDNDCNGVIDNVGQPGGCIAIVTSLVQANCGTVLTNLNDVITAHYVVGATGYRFRIKNMTTNEVVIRDRPINSFKLSDLTGFPGFVNLNTTYSIDIALLINNVWQSVYGSSCSVTTANPGATIGAHCGTTLVSMNQWIYATYNSNVAGYRFRVTNTTDASVQITDQLLNRFRFNQLPVQAPNTVYFVEVALKNTDGTYLPYGTGCNVTTGSARMNSDADLTGEFNVIAYPNPYTDDFKLNIKTSSQGTIQIRVYDMLGKQIENKDVQLSEMENLEIGANYPAGVYNVIVSQQNVTQTVRVIKR